MYRQNAKISALSSGKLDKYEYLTGEDLGYKPDAVQKTKFEYSALGQVFNKGLDSNRKQEGLLKRLKNIEDKNEQQLDLIRDQGDKQLDRTGRINVSNTKAIDFYDGPNKILKNLVDRAREETNENENRDKIFSVTISDKTFDFNRYTNLTNFGSKIFTKTLSLDKARDEQKEILGMINELEKKFGSDRLGRSLGKDKQEKAKDLIKNTKKLFKTRNDIIDAFEGKEQTEKDE